MFKLKRHGRDISGSYCAHDFTERKKKPYIFRFM